MRKEEKKFHHKEGSLCFSKKNIFEKFKGGCIAFPKKKI
jgi:hypothetical protein